MADIPQTPLSLRTKLLIWTITPAVLLWAMGTPWENIPIPVALTVLVGYLTRTRPVEVDDEPEDDDPDEVREAARMLRNRRSRFPRTDRSTMRKGKGRHRYTTKPLPPENDV